MRFSTSAMAFSSKQLSARKTPSMMLLLVLGMAGIAVAWQSPSSMTKYTQHFAQRSSALSMSSSPSQDKSSGLSYSSIPTNTPSMPQSSSPLVPSASHYQKQTRRRGQLYKDVVIIGGGLAGLSTALYLTQIDPERRITILDRNDEDKNNAGNQASMAAAGMLAPNSERLPKGDYRDLCMASKRMYSDFVGLVESMAQESGEEGHRFLHQDGTNLEPWNIGYVASGGFLAPAFAGDTVATWAPPEHFEDSDGSKTKKVSSAIWLDATQARELEPHLHPEVVGGWWFPEDASVDARRLTCSLKAACAGAGVEFLCGARNEVTSLDLQDGVCKGVWLGSESSRYVSAKAVLVANGAWMRNLLPVPLEPHKGQSLSLRMPKDRPPILRRVLFGGDSYIVPKADGRIVVGATVEAGSFDDSVTPAGLMHVLHFALELVPGLGDLPIEETWAGLRPTTPDKGPILGETPWENLFLAGGYWRNGVLLAPKTGQLLATLIANSGSNKDGASALQEDDRAMLEAFAWDRFTSPEGGKKMAADARYAASMYPVHQRKSGTGIAASVGTELGSYSTARSAGEERSMDRKALFGDESTEMDAETEELFEKAAQMGRDDADVFEGFGEGSIGTSEKKSPEKLKFYYPEQEKALRKRGEKDDDDIENPPIMEVVESDKLSSSLASNTTTETPVPYGGSADAITVGSATESDEATATDSSDNGLTSIYESIRANKAKQDVDLPDQNVKDDRPDPGFRISHVDKKTGKVREIPPYTSPGEFFVSIEAEEAKAKEASTSFKSPVANEINPVEQKATAEGSVSGNTGTYAETTFDGYQDIMKANGRMRREDELKKMKEARLKNRSSAPVGGETKKLE